MRERGRGKEEGRESYFSICLPNLDVVVTNNQSIVEVIKSLRNTSAFLPTEECCNSIISILPPHDEIPSLPKPQLGLERLRTPTLFLISHDCILSRTQPPLKCLSVKTQSSQMNLDSSSQSLQQPPPSPEAQEPNFNRCQQQSRVILSWASFLSRLLQYLCFPDLAKPKLSSLTPPSSFSNVCYLCASQFTLDCFHQRNHVLLFQTLIYHFPSL